MSRRTLPLLFCFLVLLFLPAPLQAQNAPNIHLRVDASEAPRKIFHAQLTIPAEPGDLTLVYPKWIPGEHGPTGPVDDLAGLKFTAGGQTLAWRRDPVDMYAFHLRVPAGATAVEAQLDYLSPASAEGFSSGASASAQMTVVSWNQLLLYPAGAASDAVTIQASLKLPAGWKFGTALPVTREAGESVEFLPVTLTTLVDSPVITGAYYRKFDLTPGQTPSHEIDAAADSPAALEMPEETLNRYKQLVAETGALFGARHYHDYHFLLTLSDYVAHFGLEHHESSDDRVGERTLIDANERKLEGSLLPHEFTHSWNGKYRRPAGLATANYQEPMKGDLLWVYEGLTEYFGDILAARSGLWTPEQYRDNLAHVAGYLNNARPGRTWRSLADTNVAAQLLYSSPAAWSSWRRGVDYYDEGELIWLEADVTLRQLTGGKKSLDDFAHLFHGPGTMAGIAGNNGVLAGPPALLPYTLDDVVNAMNQVAPFDWRKFFNERLNSLNAGAPLGGIEQGGWRLIYDDTPGEMEEAAESARRQLDAIFSIGLALNDAGTIQDVVTGSAAYRSGLGPGMKLIAVNGRRFSVAGFNDALAAAAHPGAGPIELIVENGEYYRTFRVDYHDGKRYPHLVRDAGRPDVLAEIIKQHAPSVAAPVPRIEIVR